MPSRRDLLIGQLALEREYINEEQLSEALRMQGDLSAEGVEQDLAEVLVSMGHVTQVQAEKLAAAASSSELAPAPEVAPRARARKAQTRGRGTGRSRPITAARPRIRAEADYAEPEKSKQGMMIGIVAGAAVVMIAVVALFASNGGGDKKPRGEGEAPTTPAAPRAGTPPQTPAWAPPLEGEDEASKSPKDLVPPGDAARNVLPNGSLDEPAGYGFKYWKVRSGGIRAKSDRDTGNGWCEFPAGGGYLEQKLALRPEWVELRVSAVMKCTGLEFGEGPNDTFRVGIHFEDADGDDLGSPKEVPELIEDADWVDVWAVVPVPGDKDVRHMVLRPGNFGVGGVCAVDEIRVIPQKVMESAARPGPPREADRPDEPPGGEPVDEAPLAAPVDDASQIAYWKFDEGAGTIAGDSTRHARNGMVLGARWTTGRRGGALEFDGVRACVEVPGADEAERESYTLSAWIRPAAGQPEETGVVVGKGRTQLVYWRDGTVSMFHTVEGAAGDEPVRVRCRRILPPGGWHHLAAVVEAGAAVAVLYVNGSRAASGGWGDPGLRGRAMKQQWTIGTGPDEGEPFKGAIDEVRIYTRALAAGEVRALYQLDRPTAEPAEPAEAPAIAPAEEPPAAAGTAERDARLARFLALVMNNRYGDAAELAKKAAKDPALADCAAQFHAAAGVARALQRRLVHVQGKMSVMTGVKMKIETVDGPREGKVAGADNEGIHLSKDIVINREVAGQTVSVVPWSEITPAQMKELAAAWKPDDADGYAALAILAAGGKEKDIDALADALDGARDHPLMDWVIGLTEE